MSTYWFYRFRGRLRPDLAALDIGALRTVAGERFRVPLPADRDGSWCDAREPVLGPDLVYDGSRFLDLPGAEVVEGELLMATHATNLEREPFEDEEGITEGAEGSRLDQLLRFLSWATEGVPGEIVGCITCEHEPRHADPLVRCADGRVRVARSERIHPDHGSWFAPEPEDIPVPEVLPCDLMRIEDASHARLDCEGLRRRYRALDGTLTPTMVDGAPRT